MIYQSSESYSHLIVAFQMRMVIINLSSGNNAQTVYPALFQEGTTLLTLLPVYISYMSSDERF